MYVFVHGKTPLRRFIKRQSAAACITITLLDFFFCRTCLEMYSLLYVQEPLTALCSVLYSPLQLNIKHCHPKMFVQVGVIEGEGEVCCHS